MTVRLLTGDCRDVLPTLPAGSVQCVVTSPPYFGLRSYLLAEHEHKHAEMGAEPTLVEYIAGMVAVFREVRRVLRDDGVVWLNLGDAFYSGGNNANRSRLAQRGSPYGTADTELRGYPRSDSAYRHLCDGCLAALSNRISGSDRRGPGFASPRGLTSRDNGRLDSASTSQGDALPSVPASTMIESSEPPPGECWHCDNCGACLSVLRSASRDARLCVRNSGNMSDIESTLRPSVDHIEDRVLSGKALTEPPIVQTDYTANLKPKDLMMVPARLAIALCDDGWYLRSDIIWAKKAPMPESVRDRPTSAHEHIFLLSNRRTYFYDAAAVAEQGTKAAGRDGTFGKNRNSERIGYPVTGNMIPGVKYEVNGIRNLRNVWHLGPEPYPDAHFATFPPEIPRRCILAGTSERGQCPACGAPWVRVINRVGGVTTGRTAWQGPANLERGVVNASFPNKALNAVVSEHVTTGWQPSCTCDAGDPIPQTVLDPFSGAGTTGLVADRLGRNYIGIDISVTYTDMARNRITNDAPMFAEVLS